MPTLNPSPSSRRINKRPPRISAIRAWPPIGSLASETRLEPDSRTSNPKKLNSNKNYLQLHYNTDPALNNVATQYISMH